MRRQRKEARSTGLVRSFDQEEGWGVIDGPDVPGGCFVHFSHILGEGYRWLDPGEDVEFTHHPFPQDGCAHSATKAWRATSR